MIIIQSITTSQHTTAFTLEAWFEWRRVGVKWSASGNLFLRCIENRHSSNATIRILAFFLFFTFLLFSSFFRSVFSISFNFFRFFVRFCIFRLSSLFCQRQRLPLFWYICPSIYIYFCFFSRISKYLAQMYAFYPKKVCNFFCRCERIAWNGRNSVYKFKMWFILVYRNKSAFRRRLDRIGSFSVCRSPSP